MPTKRHPPSFRCQLLLLSAVTLVACSKAFRTSSVTTTQPDRAFTMQPDAVVPEEKRGLDFVKNNLNALKDLVAVPIVRHYPYPETPVDYLFRSMIDLKKPNLFGTPEFNKVASLITSAHLPHEKGIKALFGGLVRADLADGNNEKFAGLRELIRQILYFKDYPQLPFAKPRITDEISVSMTSSDNHWQRQIVLELETPLLEHLKSKGLTTDDFYELLNVDPKSSAFFADPFVLPMMKYLYEYTHWTKGGPFDLVLSKFQESLSDIQIATKLLAANAETEPGSVGFLLMRALFRVWSKRNVKPDELLLELVPSLEGKDILNGPPKLWVMYFELSLKQELYPTMLRTLLRPYDALALSGVTSDVARNRDKELALVDIIVSEWDKFFAARTSATSSPSASPLAKPIFDALCSHWEKNKLSLKDMSFFLQLNTMDGLRPKRGRQWAWMLFALFLNSDSYISSLMSKFEMGETAQIVALIVDLDEGASLRLSASYFK